MAVILIVSVNLLPTDKFSYSSIACSISVKLNCLACRLFLLLSNKGTGLQKKTSMPRSPGRWITVICEVWVRTPGRATTA